MSVNVNPLVVYREAPSETSLAQAISSRRNHPLRQLGLLMLSLLAAALSTPVARAAVVTWDVDPTNSFIRLTIPDQTLTVTNVGNVTVRIRDANSTTQWTDAGGRRAALDGVVVTDYEDGRSIHFLGGTHNLRAVESTRLRPNPAAWDAAAANYTNTSTAPAALGGRVRGTYILTFDMAYLAFRDVQLDVASDGSVPINNGAFATNTTRCGISNASLDVDGLELPLSLGQPVPDVQQASLGSIIQTNAGGGTITNLGGLARKLTYSINIPNLAFDLSGTMVSGSATGLVVAYAVLPAPPPPPTLTTRKLGSEIVLSWPTNATGFLLEYAIRLPAATWVTASPPPVILKDQYVVTNTLTRPAAFYRLRKP